MNDKYISVSKFKQMLANLDVKGFTPAVKKGIEIALRDAVPQFLDDEPAADVLPIKYGEWIFQGQYDKEGRRIYHCSECNFEVGVFPYNFIAWRTHEKYCCGCGARMDGVTK